MISTLKGQIRSLQAEKQTLSGQLLESEQKISKLANRNDESKKELESLRCQNITAELKLQENEQRRIEMQKSQDALMKSFEELRSEIGDRETTVSDVNSKIKGLQDEAIKSILIESRDLGVC